jgi:acyl carrier protein
MTTDAQIYNGLSEIFADVFMRDDISLSPELTAKNVEGWDSFKQIEIIMASEEKWRIRFNTRELDALRCVGDLARMIGRKLGQD